MTDCDYQSSKQFYIIYWITLACACLSILSSLFIILSYLSLKKINQGGQYRLIIYLTIADLTFAIQRLIVHNPCQLDMHDANCKAQSFLQTFSGYSSLIWTFVFTLVLYRENKYQDQPFQLFGVRSQICYLLLGYGLPFFLSIIILITDSFGPVRYWCWIPVPHLRHQIHPTNKEQEDNLLLYFWIALFIFILWGVIITNLIFYCLIVSLFNKKFRKTQLMIQNSLALGQSIISEQNISVNINQSPVFLSKQKVGNFTQTNNVLNSNLNLKHSQSSKSKTQQPQPFPSFKPSKQNEQVKQSEQEQKYQAVRSFIQNTISRSSIRAPNANALLIYPIVLIILWLIPTINRLWTLFSPLQNHQGLFIAHTICMTMTGFVNSIVYGLNGNVRREIGRACSDQCPCLRKKITSSIEIQHSFINDSKSFKNNDTQSSMKDQSKNSRNFDLQSQRQTNKLQSGNQNNQIGF